MRLLIVLIYLFVLISLLIAKQYILSLIMFIFALGFIIYLPTKQRNEIKQMKEKIKNAIEAHKEGKKVKPFIEINSSPWYILNELPGVNETIAKHAIKLKKQNGPYPSIHVFLAVANLKPVFSELIKVVAYVKDEKPPVNIKKNN